MLLINKMKNINLNDKVKLKIIKEENNKIKLKKAFIGYNFKKDLNRIKRYQRHCSTLTKKR